eukprot:8546431-Lingulodinium_polyedra.AAC.1
MVIVGGRSRIITYGRVYVAREDNCFEVWRHQFRLRAALSGCCSDVICRGLERQATLRACFNFP